MKNNNKGSAFNLHTMQHLNYKNDENYSREKIIRHELHTIVCCFITDLLQCDSHCLFFFLSFLLHELDIFSVLLMALYFQRNKKWNDLFMQSKSKHFGQITTISSEQFNIQSAYVRYCRVRADRKYYMCFFQIAEEASVE